MNPLVIKSKALFMLVVFAANFYTVCHCAPMASAPDPLHHSPAASPHPHSCCEGRHPAANPESTKPCGNNDGCTHAHSIKFNLLEKQTASPISLHPVPAALFSDYLIPPVAGLSQPGSEPYPL